MKAQASRPTKYWHRLEDGRVACDLCPRCCKLHEGQAGLCFVRVCQHGEIRFTTWGRSSGFCVDPIEKKPLFHFLCGTPVLSFGTAGCNLACRFCQNWHISKARQDDVLADRADPQTIARAARDLGCRSVAFTYNDPIVFHEYAIEVADACHELDIRTVAVSSGYVNPRPRAEFYDHMDAVNVDLKAFTERFYHRICSGSLAPVLDTLKYVRHETDVWLEVTTLLIPGENDSEAEITGMAGWVFENLGPEVPWHFSAFHPAWRLSDRPPTPVSTLRRARHIARDEGMRHVYTGNVRDPDGESTWCHECGGLLIGRDGYRITRWNLTDDARCVHCTELVAGIFEREPGDWGRRFEPVRLAEWRQATR
ncbi:MAG: AmmeMemoRadiSam system radical SAM enzyme [Rhodospirillales bacterium]|nr:MAG: AmmeMemoRadiSam system radical SAM enzyme [Rhodospirillales bacterium]